MRDREGNYQYAVVRGADLSEITWEMGIPSDNLLSAHPIIDIPANMTVEYESQGKNLVCELLETKSCATLGKFDSYKHFLSAPFTFDQGNNRIIYKDPNGKAYELQLDTKGVLTYKGEEKAAYTPFGKQEWFRYTELGGIPAAELNNDNVLSLLLGLHSDNYIVGNTLPDNTNSLDFYNNKIKAYIQHEEIPRVVSRYVSDTMRLEILRNELFARDIEQHMVRLKERVGKFDGASVLRGKTQYATVVPDAQGKHCVELFGDNPDGDMREWGDDPKEGASPGILRIKTTGEFYGAKEPGKDGAHHVSLESPDGTHEHPSWFDYVQASRRELMGKAGIRTDVQEEYLHVMAAMYPSMRTDYYDDPRGNPWKEKMLDQASIKRRVLMNKELWDKIRILREACNLQESDEDLFARMTGIQKEDLKPLPGIDGECRSFLPWSVAYRLAFRDIPEMIRLHQNETQIPSSDTTYAEFERSFRSIYEKDYWIRFAERKWNAMVSEFPNVLVALEHKCPACGVTFDSKKEGLPKKLTYGAHGYADMDSVLAAMKKPDGVLEFNISLGHNHEGSDYDAQDIVGKIQNIAREHGGSIDEQEGKVRFTMVDLRQEGNQIGEMVFELSPYMDYRFIRMYFRFNILSYDPNKKIDIDNKVINPLSHVTRVGRTSSTQAAGSIDVKKNEAVDWGKIISYEFRNEGGIVVCYANHANGVARKRKIQNVEIVNDEVRVQIDGEFYQKTYRAVDQKLLANSGAAGFYAKGEDGEDDLVRIASRQKDYWIEWRNKNADLPLFLAWTGVDLGAYYVEESGKIKQRQITNRSTTLPGLSALTKFVEVDMPPYGKRYLKEPPLWKEFELMPGAVENLKKKKK